MGRPDFPRTIMEFQDRFATEVACLDYLAASRWPEGFICPGCGGHRAWVLDNAMITARPYRAPMSTADAMEELRRSAGTQFDPRVLDALLRVLAAQAAEPVPA